MMIETTVSSETTAAADVTTAAAEIATVLDLTTVPAETITVVDIKTAAETTDEADLTTISGDPFLFMIL